MKQCTYCGKEAPDEADVCPLDGSPLKHKPEPVASGQPPKMAAPVVRPSSIKSLCSWFQGLGLIAIGLGVIFILCITMSSGRGDPDDKYFIYFGIFCIVQGGSLIVVAYGLAKRMPWAWTLGTVFSVLGLLNFPIGTILFGIMLYKLSKIKDWIFSKDEN
jgi:hypothetical protein